MENLQMLSGNLKKELKGKDIVNILEYLKKNYYKDIAFTTGGGYSGSLLLYYIKEIIPQIPIYFIDTGYHFQETLDYINLLKNEWKLNIVVCRPYFSKKDIEKIIGSKPYEKNPNLCCHFLKVEPLLRVLHLKKIWLSALRRDQSITRQKIEKVELDGRGVVKIYPFAHWTKNKILNEIEKKNIPLNPLFYKGYHSIGCKPCTSKTESFNERNGRWENFPKLECGINF